MALSGRDTRAAAALYTPLCCCQALISAALVCLRQLAPDTEAVLLGRLSVGARQLAPLHVVGTVLAAALLPQQAGPRAAFVLGGTYATWLYLRVFQDRGEGLRGDPAEDMRFAAFFPGPLQGPVDSLAGACSRVTRIAPPQPVPGALLPRGALAGLGGGVLPGTHAADVSRRR
ncbi:hypothetical protein H632_c3132p0 [Helicosporidium sp. ATCC 50920]|nr:hypothetical protein H632_c3132p0 [Helicosporidium sp. ATCC 50920]|eukprot:KDD72607.1 hypothetical protein H632_c3132p0 [Helicosporidium sp. ATCC 50920]